tara:strand:- start:6406 stop:6837 length:432 start_codon:yes stop_codon:yes gene_type:complete
LIACFTAQLLKLVFNLANKRELRFGIIFESGGMPSSHSALITGVTSGLGWDLGFNSSTFALSVCISLIVMYDASGIRRSAGLQATQINIISKTLDDNSLVKLKETIGHTKPEVIVGAIIGPMVVLPGIVFIGSPSNILNLFIN